jgi:hypothetical protein
MKITPLRFLLAVAGSVVSIGCQETVYASLYPAILLPYYSAAARSYLTSGSHRATIAFFGTTMLMIFGGPNRRVCLSCLIWAV